jgi:hypothetical protein
MACKTGSKKMSETEIIASQDTIITRRTRGRPKSGVTLPERRGRPHPRLAEIGRGGQLNLLSSTVVTGAVRMIEFLLVAGLGFAIYLAYVEREGQNAHLVYLAAVAVAAAANTLILQALDLYRLPAFNAFVSSFARIALAWTVVIGGMMSLAFFVKVGADFSRVWIASWYDPCLARAAAGARNSSGSRRRAYSARAGRL